MGIVNVHAAKTNLSKLIEQAEAGEDVIIARDSEPSSGLCRSKRVFGSMQGKNQPYTRLFRTAS